MKKLLSLFLAAAFAFTAISCNSNTAQPEPQPQTSSKKLIASFKLGEYFADQMAEALSQAEGIPIEALEWTFDFYNDKTAIQTQLLTLNFEQEAEGTKCNLKLKIGGPTSWTYTGDPLTSNSEIKMTEVTYYDIPDFDSTIPQKYIPFVAEELSEEEIIELFKENGVEQDDGSYVINDYFDFKKEGLERKNTNSNYVETISMYGPYLYYEEMFFDRTYPEIPEPEYSEEDF